MSKLITSTQLKSCMTTVKEFIAGIVTTVAAAIDEVDKAKADKTSVILTTNTSEYTPTADYHPATKKYVDDAVSDAGAHSAVSIASADGAHDLRLYNGALQYDDNGTWKTLSISDLII